MIKKEERKKSWHLSFVLDYSMIYGHSTNNSYTLQRIAEKLEEGMNVLNGMKMNVEKKKLWELITVRKW